jgi:hypothetical protein
VQGERAYIYAKACGMIAKSFVEDRVSRLSAVSSIETLDDLVFGVVNSVENIDDIEKRLTQREHEAIAKILKCFSRVPPLLSLLAESDNPAQNPSDEKNASSPETLDIAEITRQNNGYYTALWHELEKTPLSDRKLIGPVIADEIRLKNAVWALRLRVYYNMSSEDIKGFLTAIKPKANQSPLHNDALKSLELDIEEEAQWHDWRFWKYVNKPISGQYWKIDPRYFQNQASLHLYHLARKSLRKSPFTLDTACCFIKLKQFEKEVLTSVAEAVRLGLTGGDALEILGLPKKAA